MAIFIIIIITDNMIIGAPLYQETRYMQSLVGFEGPGIEQGESKNSKAAMLQDECGPRAALLLRAMATIAIDHYRDQPRDFQPAHWGGLENSDR